MLAFLLFFIPILIVFYCFYTKNGKNVIPISIGVLVATLFCTFKSMFFFSHRVIPYSFTSNLIFHLLQGCLPVIILILLAFVITKDEIETKVKFIFPLCASYYAIYVPYFVINSVESSVYSSFSLFIRPLIYASMILYISYGTLYMNKFWSKKVFVVLDAILLLPLLILPAFFDAMYDVGASFVFTYIASIVYSIIPLAFSVFLFIKRSK